MLCDENSFEHDKETSSSQVRTKIFYFMFKSSILVAWINDGRPSFLLWLRLRLRTLSSSCGAICFKIFSRWIWRDCTSFGRRSFIHCFVEPDVFWLCLFTATELSSCVASFETTGNLETFTFLRWLWICCCVVFICLCFAGLGIIRILSRCWRQIAKILFKMDTETLKYDLLFCFTVPFSLAEKKMWNIWRCILCNAAMDFFWVVKLPRVHDAQWIASLRIFFF